MTLHLGEFEFGGDAVGALARFKELANGIGRASSTVLCRVVLLDISFWGSLMCKVCWVLNG